MTNSDTHADTGTTSDTGSPADIGGAVTPLRAHTEPDEAPAGKGRGPRPPATDAGRSLYAGVRRAVHAHALLTDAVLAVVLLGLATAWLVHARSFEVGTAVVQTALIVPLVWRRSDPTVVFAVIAGVAGVQWILGYRLVGDAALLVALYTVAVHERRNRTVAAVVVLEAGAVLASTRWEPAGTLPRSLVFLTATVVAALFAGMTVRSGSEYMAWLAERARRLEIERDQQAAIGAARERTRIARELHDIVAHSLSVVITLADAAALVSATDPERAARTMHQVSDVGRQALRDMRTMIGVLRTDDPGTEFGPQPDIAQIGTLLDRVAATGLAVAMETTGTPFALGAATELSVYRILQEALTNVIKHSSATTVRVTLHYADPVVELTVEDDGVGGTSARGDGHGIDGMTERAGLHDGSLVAGPGDGSGWVVSAALRASGAVTG